MSEVGVTRDQIDIVRWTSSSDLGRRAAALLQRQNYGEGGKTVMKGVDLLGVPVGLLSVTFPDLPLTSFCFRKPNPRYRSVGCTRLPLVLALELHTTAASLY